jgi:hypothetical protein
MMSNLKESLVYDTYQSPSQSVYEAIDAMPPPPQQYSQQSNDYSKTTNQNDRSYSIENLYETWLAKLHIIDKELANEFSVIFFFFSIKVYLKSRKSLLDDYKSVNFNNK